MKLLSFSINFHDSTITYFDGNKIHFYKHERISQEKHAKITSIEQVIGIVKERWDLYFDEFDAISAYLEGPELEGNNIKVSEYDTSTYTNTSNFILATSFVYDTELDSEYGQSIEINKRLLKKYNIQRVDHHLCHYLSAKFLTNKKINYGFVIDGEGEPNVCGSIYKDDKCINRLYSETNGSIGAFLERLAIVCGIKASQTIDGPGKLMSLQSYGELNQDLYNMLSTFSVLSINELDDFIFNEDIKNRFPILDLAKTVHTFIGDCILNLFKFYATTDDTIIYSGGVAQNIVWNTQLRKSFPNIVIPPYSSDEGLSLGALRYLMEKYECI